MLKEQECRRSTAERYFFLGPYFVGFGPGKVGRHIPGLKLDPALGRLLGLVVPNSRMLRHHHTGELR